MRLPMRVYLGDDVFGWRLWGVWVARRYFIGFSMSGQGYRCTYCGNFETAEREVYCWKCSKGEMVWTGSENP